MFWLFQSLLLVFRGASGNTVSQGSSPSSVVNGILGESVTFPLNFPMDEKVNMISWTHNGIILAVISLNELGKRQLLVPDKNGTKRLTFTQSYSLHLSNLTMTDTGFYKAQINTKSSLMFSSYTLRIFRRLSNLKVTHHIQLSGNSTCEIHLICSVENPNDTVSFGWKFSGNISLREPNLTIFWDPKISSEQKYTCIAENPVSNLSFSVTAQSLCTGSLRLRTQQTQHPAESLQNIEYTSVSPGSTVYAHVTYPKQEMGIPTPTKKDTVTIYSTINHSKETKTTSPRATALNNIK
ncbi:SLAM family member 6 isoform X2 [Sciurus carolinensis]|uniref:SLAM family member 6 isoform X2 n=1 Tax=Sciurus carolinensis TaxID=30640 RepID=UPI001FB44814|nr:SLAM family member 6 isoform X2 [Sciurus carolinensis]